MESNENNDINNNITNTTTTTTTTTTNTSNDNNNNTNEIINYSGRVVGEEQITISPANESILMVPEIDMDTPPSTTPNPIIQQQSIEEQQKQYLQNEYKVSQLSIETENDKMKEQAQTQQQQQQEQEGYGNDEVTEIVLKNVLYVSNKVLSGAQYVGNIFAEILGFGEHKYQDHLDEYNMIQEEKKRKMEKEAKIQSDMESGEGLQNRESSISVSSTPQNQ